MKNTGLLLFLLFLSQAILAQESYSDYSKSQRKDILYDHFVDNRNNWSVYVRDNISLNIKNDYYYLSYSDSSASRAKSLTIPVDFDLAADYEVEASIRLVENSFGKANCVQFEKTIYIKEGSIENPFTLEKSESKKVNKVYQFGFNSQSYFRVDKWESGYTSIIPMIKSSFIEQGRFNKLTVRRVSGVYYFFINENLVSSRTISPIYGNRFGFLVNAGSSMVVDYIRVSTLGKKAANTAPEIIMSDPFVNKDTVATSDNTIRISGSVRDDNGVYSVLVNGQDAILQENGYFGLDVPLTPGSNLLILLATDKQGAETSKMLYVKRVQGAQTFANQKRTALIIGNTSYTGHAHLGSNPVNDANDMATTLESIGFKVIKAIDANREEMIKVIREFGRENRDSDIALFFFSGHGMQIDKENYLIPINAVIKEEQDVSFEGVPVERVQKTMESSNSNRLNIIILDACRNNPFQGWNRGGDAGLATINPPSGTLIAFSTSPGSTASNGDSRNGLYTGELIKQLRIPQRIEDVFINTRNEVEKKSGNTQSPWEYSRLRGAFYLKK